MRFTGTLVVAVVTIVSFCPLALGQPWTIQQLTNNDYWDLHPVISGPNIVWYMDDGRPVLTGCELFLYNGSTTVQITHNNREDRNYSISERYLVWSADADDTDPFQDEEIFRYDLASGVTEQLTDDDIPDWAPRACGSNVVWFTIEGFDRNVYLYDGSRVSHIAPGIYPTISGSIMAWSNSFGVWYRDIHTDVNILPPGGAGGRYPYVNRSKIVWEGWDGWDWEIFLHDIDTGITQQLTDNRVDDRSAQVSGSNVVWASGNVRALDADIYFYDGVMSRKIGTHGGDPQIDGSDVVWHASDGGALQVFYFDGARTYQITDNGLENSIPSIDNLTIVWQGYDGHDMEIFRATIPEPASLLLFLGVAVALLRRHRH
jgi:hypothetical protein